MEKTVFTVSRLNNMLKTCIESEPVFSNIYVIGEISNYKLYPSGHVYFSLKDVESTLSCVLFKSNARMLRFCPDNGMQVLAVGRVSFYPRDGKVQFYVDAMMPSGAGNLQAAFERLKAKLDAEGLFSSQHKIPLPVFPERIAVITSPAGAAVRDIIRILGVRWPAAEVLVVPVRVQGLEAPAEIVEAIHLVNEYTLADLIITGRGGGSAEDLWSFNDESVARAIYASEIPVISAVGHEPDITISDYVADIRASTPSNAAEIAVPDRAEVSSAINGYSVRLCHAIQKKLETCRSLITSYASRRVLTAAGEVLNLRRMDLDLLREKLLSSQTKILTEKKNCFSVLTASLDALSPLKVLSRGYSAAFDNDGKVIRSAVALHPEDSFNLLFSDGQAGCTVNTVHSESISKRL